VGGVQKLARAAAVRQSHVRTHLSRGLSLGFRAVKYRSDLITWIARPIFFKILDVQLLGWRCGDHATCS